MKITKRPTAINGGKTVTTIRGTGARGGAKAATSGNVDRLQVAHSTSQLQELEAELAQLDISDVSKVAAIKLAVTNGSFRVNSEVVADRLIDTAKEAVRKRPRKQ